MMTEKRQSLMLTSTVLCAALYAIGCYITSYIVSPWGVGQFRPAVVIPTLFAVVFGPLPAGVGAAIGTLIADSANQGSLNVGSLIAAVPGNFFGFYFIGYYLQKKFTWSRFILSSITCLIFANLIVAVLYIGVFMKFFTSQVLNMDAMGLAVFIIGLTIWWFITMLPFELLVAPPLIRGVVKAFPTLVSKEVADASLGGSINEEGLKEALLLPGVLMLVLAGAITFSPLGGNLAGMFSPIIKELIQLVSFASAFILLALGAYVFLKSRK